MCKNLNNVPFFMSKLFPKMGYYSRGDIIQERTFFKEIGYLLLQRESGTGMTEVNNLATLNS